MPVYTIAALLALISVAALGQAAEPPQNQPATNLGYRVGPGDQLVFRIVNAEEIGDKPVGVDLDGCVRLPVVGRLHVAGSTVAQIEAEVRKRLSTYLLHPDVTVSVAEYRSQPVSVVGAVRNPGVQQVQGRKTLLEMLSLAGGLDTAAGSSLTLTRRLEFGRIPLPGAADDPTGQFSVASVPLRSIIEAKSPEENIEIQPHDVISVPKGRHVYVLGQVQRAGEFPLGERENVSILQAVSMAGGLDQFAKPEHTRILRRTAEGPSRIEVPVDLRRIIAGKDPDLNLSAEDIVVVPHNAPKRAALRALEKAVELGTGVIIWRR